MIERDGFIKLREGPLAINKFVLFLNRERVPEVFHLLLDVKIEPERIGIDHRNSRDERVQEHASVSAQEPCGVQMSALMPHLIGGNLQLVKGRLQHSY